MKSTILICMTAMMFLGAATFPDRVAAQNQQSSSTPVHYNAFALATDGGSAGDGVTINNLGWVLGDANLTGDTVEHATFWAYGLKFDLGTLGGPSNPTLQSDVQWPNKNTRGEIVGISETPKMDPFGEDWSCSAFFIPPASHHQCLGFVWRLGQMTPLPTLGGNNGFTAAVNNLGQAVGWAETTYHDPTCVTPQVLQFLAVIWEPDGNVKQLTPYPGDSDTAATAINDNGQVVGISGACDVAVGATSAKNAVVWENGQVINLGSFGSAGWNTPMDINSRGEVVGFANMLPDVFTDGQLDTNFTAFLWTKEGGMQNLGHLEGDTNSVAYGINDQGQIVGQSFGGPEGSQAFIYENGKMMPLGSFLPTGSTLTLLLAQGINDFGGITGEAFDSATGTAPAFLLVPTWGGDRDSNAPVPQADGNAQKLVVPESVLKQVQQRWPFRRLETKSTTPQ
jgi:probable HAF family extracellular repeat protein